MHHITKFLADTSNDSMLVKGTIGLWSFLASLLSDASALEVWNQWYGVAAQLGATIVGFAMFSVLVANFFKIRSETKNLKRQGNREQEDWDNSHAKARNFLEIPEPEKTDDQ